MNKYPETLVDSKPPWSRVTTNLLITLLASLLNISGTLLLVGLVFEFSPNPPNSFFNGPTESINVGIFRGLLAFLLLFSSFLGLSLYPRPRPSWHPFAIALVVLGTYYFGAIFSSLYLAPALGIYNPLNFIIEVSAGISITALLFVTRRVSAWSRLLGLIFGLIVGVGIYTIGNPQNSTNVAFGFPWIWLSAVFFPDLFNRRVGWQGIVVWLAFMILSPYLTHLVLLMVGLGY